MNYHLAEILSLKAKIEKLETNTNKNKKRISELYKELAYLETVYNSEIPIIFHSNDWGNEEDDKPTEFDTLEVVRRIPSRLEILANLQTRTA